MKLLKLFFKYADNLIDLDFGKIYNVISTATKPLLCMLNSGGSFIFHAGANIKLKFFKQIAEVNVLECLTKVIHKCSILFSTAAKPLHASSNLVAFPFLWEVFYEIQ